MIPRWILLTAAIVIFAPGLLPAQTRESQFGTPKEASTFFETRSTTGEAAPNNDKMYEDIEIFRRILGRKLQPLYPRVSYSGAINYPITSTGTAPLNTTLYNALPTIHPYDQLLAGQGSLYFEPRSAQNAYTFQAFTTSKEESLPSLEGVYLKGQGVVYTATLSSIQPLAKAEADSAVRVWRVVTAHEDSEWDSIRRQVRNEKEKPKTAEESKPPALSDVLLKVLAENGHHFSQLVENESLTLVLTVHDSTSSSNAAKSKTSSRQTGSKTVTSSGGHDLRGKASDLELLGDLHQKQGRFEEAIKAFGQAVDRKGLEPKEAADLYRKLAQCYLAREKIADARSAMDEVERILKNAQKSEELKPAQAATKSSAAALPVKVIISARKLELDQVKAGRITLDEFRRRASVETLRFGDRR